MKIRYKGPSRSEERVGDLVAIWDIPHSDIGSHGWNRSDARELLSIWVDKTREDHSSGVLPISWYVRVVDDQFDMMEGMPWQEPPIGNTFLDFYWDPIVEATGEPLEWLQLPVADKLWSPTGADRGWFIQEATGWKPSILQTEVPLGLFEQAHDPSLRPTSARPTSVREQDTFRLTELAALPRDPAIRR